MKRCSGLERRVAARARVRSAVAARHAASTLALIALGGCSGAGGGADDAPFAAGAGGAESASSETDGARPAGGTSAASGAPERSAPEDLADFIDAPEPEPAPEPEGATAAEVPSCAGMRPDSCQGGSCCQRESVLTAEAMQVATNVSVTLSPYALDTFEVTVGRFRKFVEEYDAWRAAGNPRAGDGAHPGTPGSGWLEDPTWALPESAEALRLGLSCNATQQTWTEQASFNDNKPINCVNWYEAFAFCAWDGGRLPTEMEWQYAAVGGAEARQFAWGDTPLEPSLAVYGCLVAGTGASCTVDDIPDVGSRPDGDGRFGHSDLNGSVLEWTLDWFSPYPELMRNDYTKTDAGTNRMLRGGCWNTTFVNQITTTTRHHQELPGYRSSATGIRCMREVEDSPR